MNYSLIDNNQSDNRDMNSGPLPSNFGGSFGGLSYSDTSTYGRNILPPLRTIENNDRTFTNNRFNETAEIYRNFGFHQIGSGPSMENMQAMSASSLSGSMTNPMASSHGGSMSGSMASSYGGSMTNPMGGSMSGSMASSLSGSMASSLGGSMASSLGGSMASSLGGSMTNSMNNSYQGASINNRQPFDESLSNASQSFKQTRERRDEKYHDEQRNMDRIFMSMRNYDQEVQDRINGFNIVARDTRFDASRKDNDSALEMRSNRYLGTPGNNII